MQVEKLQRQQHDESRNRGMGDQKGWAETHALLRRNEEPDLVLVRRPDTLTPRYVTALSSPTFFWG